MCEQLLNCMGMGAKTVLYEGDKWCHRPPPILIDDHSSLIVDGLL